MTAHRAHTRFTGGAGKLQRRLAEAKGLRTRPRFQGVCCQESLRRAPLPCPAAFPAKAAEKSHTSLACCPPIRYTERKKDGKESRP